MDSWVDEPSSAFEDVLKRAQQRLHAVGHGDARIADDDPDAEIHIVAAQVVARVDPGPDRTTRSEIQRLAGAAAVEGRVACLFSVGGFADEAVAWADRTGVALFVLDRHGELEPVGRTAADAVARSVAAAPLFGTGDLADPVEVAAVLAEGLVGGAVGAVDLWFGGAGQVLTFWIDPGDREVPASVSLSLYPWALGAPASGLDDHWERVEDRIPGGGREEVWVRRCLHANQPPTAVAGEAVHVAIKGLAACGVAFERCRVELRPPAELDDGAAADVQVARRTVLGPLGLGPRADGGPSDATDSARVVAALVDRGRAQPADGVVELEGVSEDGKVAWRLVASARKHRPASTGRWQIEVRVPADLLQADQPQRWLRAHAATVGGTRWRLDHGEWCHTVVEPDLEVAANEAVANLASAYAYAGAAFERTAFRSPA